MSPTIVIRSARLEDAEALAKLNKQTWLATYPNDEYGITHEDIDDNIDRWDSPESIESWKDRIADQNDSTLRLVALVDGGLAGFCTLYKRPDSSNLLGGFYVLPKYHGSGVANKLMEKSLVWLGNRKAISLEVAQYNRRAIRFYEKFGFKIVKEGNNPATTLPSGKSIPEYLMVKKVLAG